MPYDDLLDVSTTYLDTDLVQRTDVSNAQPSFPITFYCHTNGELLGGGEILLNTGASKSYMSLSFLYSACTPPPFSPNFNQLLDNCKLAMEF